MPAPEINPFTALTRIRSQFLRTQWSTSNHQQVDMTTLQKGGGWRVTHSTQQLIIWFYLKYNHINVQRWLLSYMYIWPIPFGWPKPIVSNCTVFNDIGPAFSPQLHLSEAKTAPIISYSKQIKWSKLRLHTHASCRHKMNYNEVYWGNDGVLGLFCAHCLC